MTLSPQANLVTGALARALAGFAMMPVTIIKVRYESSLYSYASLTAAARDIYHSGRGVGGFFAGFGATAVRDAPYAGLYVLFYEAGKAQLHSLLGTTGSSSSAASLRVPGPPSAQSAITVNFVSGIMAAAAATLITNPFDAIKTRLQIDQARYGNLVRAAGMMLRDEGWRSMFDGLGLRIARKALSSALAWTVYEELVRRAERRWMDAAMKDVD